MQLNIEQLNQCIIDGIRDKKGEDIVLINLTKVEHAVTDNFIICHANSNRQVDAIADNIKMKVRTECNEAVSHVEGEQTADWILLDYLNTVVHIFKKEIRELYKLEDLWGDAEIKYFNDENDNFVSYDR
eukprot:Anaeramoba_ignava/a608344_15.p3 GENE.a608344_15~~a608344_15.p3  ORF type:complete len:129 (-),score=6.66 a608344_15:2091-2477(-)